MVISFESVLWYLFLLDSVIYNVIVWLGFKDFKKQYKRNFRIFSRQFPLTKGYAILYLFLVLWVGSALLRLGVV
jgi:hypothetical protein